MRRLLLTTSLASLLSLTATAAELEPLKPRVEMEWRPGQDRSILQTELWMPIAQDRDSVLYGDIRVMGDQHDNREFNVGVGYREIVDAHALGKGVVGVHGWFDRRVTENHSRFNQVTLGTEWMGEMVDVKLNAYIPLNDSNLVQRQNPNSTGARLVGSQIFVNTDQLVAEEAMKGVDLELGVRVPYLDDVTDATRVYVAGYHFEGDKAEDVTGYRTRLTSDLTEDISIGARYQHDDVRGSQGFLEATVRFPFGNKKSYQEEGLRARLDESPERDIDIVTNDAIIAGAEPVALTNTTTGLAQNIIHVNNTNTGGAGGNGTAEDPFSTLAAAEGAADDNDIIYVHRGTGDTTGMSDGITIDNVGQQLIGSGADFTFDATKFGTANGLNVSNVTLIAADRLGAPVITNGAGDGVYVTADGVTVSGVTVDGASQNGIHIVNNSGTAWSSELTIGNNTIKNSGIHGLRVEAAGAGSSISHVTAHNNAAYVNSFGLYVYANGGAVNNVTFIDNIASDNTSIGLVVNAESGGAISNIRMVNNAAINNVGYGIAFLASSGGMLGNSIVRGNVSQLNSQGFFVDADNGTITKVDYRNNTATSNNNHGFYSRALNSGVIDYTIYTNNTAISNSNNGFMAYALNSGEINTVNYIENTSKANVERGFFVRANDGTIYQSDFTGNIATSNSIYGFNLLAQNDGDINRSVFENNLATSNASSGIVVNDDSAAGSIIADLGGGVFGSTGGNASDNNGLTAIFVDLDGGELKAKNNYWGRPTGLAASDRILDPANGGSTIDADPFLTSAP